MTFKELRISKGIKQTEIAEQLNVLPSAVNHWENGRFVPCKKYRDDLANILGVTRAVLDSILDNREAKQ